ncbi:restriction endonuclease subunit S [Carboxylicivirga sp. M1479]|uniref:restriction endonuclease subunit S n=1 Tax=Carboxylicivirga sp. M1479 TaxID=2594476 RepID=UPI0011783FC0|nr:restriction endonuclease subunit S [Carboxylicivirga sp. M1479]TRX72561.1 restriction endonuclease subunit S [Carboxylicivirga sp. M1479]
MREDWVEVKLGDICDFVGGGTPSKRNPNFWNGELPWASIKDIKGDFLKSTQDFITEDGLINSSANLAMPNEIILATRINPGKPIISKIKTAINQDLKVVKTKIDINSKFLFYSLKSLEKDIIKVSSGTTVLGVNLNNLRAINYNLAPLPIQRAIVFKIETLFSDLDNGIADLKKAQEQLKIYRQAVLKKAFEGELTKTWREQQTDLPSADELLEQIKQERQKHYEQQLDNWKQAVKAWEDNGKEGKKPSKPKTTIELPPLSEEELNNLPKTSKSWHWCKIDKIAGHNANALKAGPFGSSLKKEFYTPHGYKIYGQEQVISGDSKFGDYYVNEEKYKDLINCAVFPLDILISLVGTVGKVLVLPEDAEMGVINPRLVKITLNGFYDSIFFKFYFESSFLKSLYKVKNHGTTMDVLNLTSIKELPYPLCSLQEQHQIVREIESRLSVCDKIEQNISEALNKSEALRQSILKKAFESKLLSDAEINACKQEADYEPASVLLERIKYNQKVTAPRQTKKVKTSKKK